METLGIRELTAPAIAAAAKRDEPIGITNAGALAGILMPFTSTYVHQLVEQNLPHVVQSVVRGEREIAELADGPAVTLTTPTDRPPALNGAGLSLSEMLRASIRQLNGKLLEEAARTNQPIAVCTGQVMAGVIFPVSQRLVARLVEQNLSRVIYNMSRGEDELAAAVTHLNGAALVADLPVVPVRAALA